MAEDAVNNEKITTRSLIKQYFVRWRLLLLAAVLFASGALIWAHTLPLQYTGTAIFERRRDPVTTGASLRGSESFESRKETLEYDLASWEAVEKAVEEMEKRNLTKYMEREGGVLTDKGKSTKQQLVREFGKKIKINWEVSSTQIDLVSVSFTHSNQDLAEQMPNELVENYIERVSKQVVVNLTKSKEFLESQVENCNNQLIGFIKERIKSEEENKGAIPESSSVLYERIFRINSDLDARRLQFQVAQQELASLQGLEQSMIGSAEDPNEPHEIHMIPNPLLAQRQAELQQAEDQLYELMNVNTMKETHPTVQMLQRKIASLEERIKETEPMVESEYVYGRSANNPAFLMQMLRTKATVVGTDNEIKRLEGQKEKYEDILGNFGAIRQKYLEDTKKIEDKQAELSSWEGRLQSVTMSLAAEYAQRGIRLGTVQGALKQYLPSEPDLWRVLGIAVMGGLAFGGLLVFLAIRMDQSVITPEQAAKGFAIPVYGFVGVIMTPRKLFFRFLKRWVVLPIVSLLLIAVLGLLIYSLTLRLHYPEKYEKQIEQNVNKVITEAKYIGWEVKETLSDLWD